MTENRYIANPLVNSYLFGKSKKTRRYIYLSYERDSGHYSSYRHREHKIKANLEYQNKKIYIENNLYHHRRYTITKSKGKSINATLSEFELNVKYDLGYRDYYLNFYSDNSYDPYDKYNYHLINIAGIGKRFLNDNINIDINFGEIKYKYVYSKRKVTYKEYYNEKIIVPTINSFIRLSKNLSLKAKLFFLKRRNIYHEEIDLRLSYKINKYLGLTLNHHYQRFAEDDVTFDNRIRRETIFGVRIRY